MNVEHKGGANVQEIIALCAVVSFQPVPLLIPEMGWTDSLLTYMGVMSVSLLYIFVLYPLYRLAFSISMLFRIWLLAALMLINLPPLYSFFVSSHPHSMLTFWGISVFVVLLTGNALWFLHLRPFLKSKEYSVQ